MRVNKHVGIYGGTFDPIHFGHINLAIEMMEYHQLDEVWFCPANINPHKQNTISASSEHRLEMLELAIADIPAFGVIPNELQREGPSYTIDTLRELVEEESETEDPSQFFLILGADSVAAFPTWKEADEIVKIAPLLVGRRSSSEKGMTPTTIMEISATQVRDRVLKGLYIGHLVPAKVVDYIYKNRLYSDGNKS